MTAFRTLTAVLFAVILGYTAIVAGRHGFGLLPIFFGDIRALAWPGQFNVDFMSFLTLSALWLAWRHHFSPAGLVLAVCGFFGGGLFLSAYLFVVSIRVRGDVTPLLLGPGRAAR